MNTKLCALLMGVVVAQVALADDPDPPSLVARVSYVQGDAGLQAGDSAAEQVEVNRPVTIGDRLRTENHALVELSLGTSAVRLDENTDVTVANLDADVTQLQLDSGVVSLHVYELDRNDNIEIDTPTATVHVLEPGDYRVDTMDDGTTRVAVRHGDAELDGGGGPVHVRDQQQLIFAGSNEPAEVGSLTTPDDFDQWGMSRDRQFENSRSVEYVSRDVVGYEDLDSNGTWQSEADYGEVWYPNRIAADWAPYRYGRWVWVQPWGWSWVDDSPWGFAPFHYGRWAYVRNRWGWVPGPRNTRHVYAPALVAWDGDRGRGAGSFTISNRPQRWFPLGPREVYVPAHRASPRYLRNVNVTNTRIVNESYLTNAYENRGRDMRYANRNAPNAVTTRDILPRGARPAPVMRPLPPRPEVARGIVQREGVPVAARPPQPFPGPAGFRSPEVDRAREGQRDNLGARRLEPGVPVNVPPQFQRREQVPQREQFQQRGQAQDRVEEQRAELQRRDQLQQQQRDQAQQQQQQQQRDDLRQRGQVQEREQRQQLEQFRAQQLQQQQLRGQQEQLRQQQGQQQEQIRAQQDQMRAQQAQQAQQAQFRQQQAQQDQFRQQQAQRQEQMRAQQQQFRQAPPMQRPVAPPPPAAAPSPPRPVERRDDGGRRGHAERDQLR